MKDIFSDNASTPARAPEETNTRRGVITPDGDRGDDDNDQDELSKLTQLDEAHSPEQQIVVKKKTLFCTGNYKRKKQKT